MPYHNEVPVKVNAFVDEGVADLVLALSEVPGLVTLESCQGGNGQDAYVFFRLGDWRQAGEFLFDRLVVAMPPDLRSSVSLRLQAYDTDNAVAEITAEPCAVDALVRCIRTSLGSTVRSGVLVTRDAHSKAIAETIIAASLD